MTEKMGLDLGCGDRKHTEIADTVIGLDIRPLRGVDIVCDFSEYPLKLDSEKFDAVIMDNSLEHIDYSKFADLINEIWRIMKYGATFTIIVPHHTNPTSLEPEHTLRFSMASLSCIDNQYKNTPTTIKQKFHLLSKTVCLITPFSWLSGFISRFPDIYEYRLCHFIPAKDITFVFQKVRLNG
jgi:ubiquinone/menaquinone biosynthesis C-methylase UbiE